GGRVMLTCPTHLPIDFCTTPVDFRKSFDGLTGVITAVFGSSVLDSHLFLFINKRRDRIPIDNNDVEQLMKQVATGRKNWLFLGSPDAGDRAATLLTLISTGNRTPQPL
ncbi:MAG: IS66 family insertion sequence element accessory protein TnpB, partial [Planctomyces sp.]